jgi:hypothetical protein
MVFRVWFDPIYKKNESEAEDAISYEAISAESAAQKFAEERYSYMQHVDPGMVLVRDLETNEVTRWSIAVRISFVADKKAPPVQGDAGGDNG